MINKCTLNVENIKVPDECNADSQFQLRAILFAGTVCMAIGLMSELTFTVVLSSHHGKEHNVGFMLGMTAASLATFFVSWLLTAKFGVYFRGFGIVVAFVAIELKFEGMLQTDFNYNDMAAMFMLINMLSSIVITMGEQHYIAAATAISAISIYAGIRITLRFGQTLYYEYALSAVLSVMEAYTIMWIRKKSILEEAKSKLESEKWKSILMLLNDAVVICGGEKILFSNQAMSLILPGNPDASENSEYVTGHLDDSAEAPLSKVQNFLKSYTLRSKTGKCFVCKGILELHEEHTEGEFVMILGENDTEVKYTLNCKRIVFNDVEATLFLIRNPTDTEKVHRSLVEKKYRTVLLSTITHELKTPLMIINGNLELLLKEVNKSQTPHLEAALLASKLLKYFLYGINDVKKLVEGHLDIRRNRVNLERLFERLKQFTQLTSKIRNLGLSIKLTGPVPPAIVTDKRRLTLVLLNLLQNAIKYTFKGHVQITGHLKDNSILVVEVEDTGIGIEPGLLSKIYRMFGSVDSKSSTRESGMGIGLFLCKRILTALNGKLDIRSERGKGTKCVVEVPVMDKDLSAIDESEEQSSLRIDNAPGSVRSAVIPHPSEVINVTPNNDISAEEKKKPKILVVDDDPLVLLAVRCMLAKLGCEVSTAGNGALALEEIAQRNDLGSHNAVDIVVMDANMPVMNGYDSSTSITRLKNEGRIQSVNIVSLSAQDSRDHADLCKASGMNYIIEKPCSMRTLKEMLNFYGYS